MKIMKTVARTWWERLCSWPWHPSIKTKEVRDLKAEFARPPHASERAFAGHVPPRPMPAPAERSNQVPPHRNPTRPTSSSDDVAMLAVLPMLVATPVDAAPASDDPAPAPFKSGGGGSYAGGGAFDSWEVAPATKPSERSVESAPSSSDSVSSSSDSASSSSDSTSTSGDSSS